jgi:hypothetical protein
MVTYGFDENQKRTQEHALRGVEVYPRLGDSLFKFKDRIESVPKEQHSKFIRDFIGLSGKATDYNFNEVLQLIKNPPANSSEKEKKYNIDIYKAMVKQFLLEIEKLGYKP